MYNILINAYAVAPNYGSEPGMGWNWIINLAKHCQLFVITEGEWKDKIQEALEELPQAKNIHFFYNDLPEKVREMSRNQGDWRFYYYYRIWQKQALKIAEKIIAKNHIDIIHQLNMIGFREPGYLWQIKNIPFVWGPIGGLSQFPVQYLQGAGIKNNLTNRLKNIINSMQLRYSPRVQKAIKRADALISATSEGQRWLQQIYKRKVMFLNETGCYIRDNIRSKKENQDKKFKIVWAGRFYFRKQLNLALKSVAKLSHLDSIELHILGCGSKRNDEFYRATADKLGISDICKWYGNIETLRVHEVMSDSDVFLFTSIMDATSTVVMEAIQNNLPIICHDTCGFGPIVDEAIGKKIQITNPEQSVAEFSEIINYFYNHRDELDKLSRNCRHKQKELSWDSKIGAMLAIYNKVTS